MNFERRTITLNASEKGGNPRIFKVSPKPIEMLNNLPRKIRKSSQFQALEGHNGIPQTKDPLHLRSCLDAKNLIRHYFTFK
jgi:integrase